MYAHRSARAQSSRPPSAAGVSTVDGSAATGSAATLTALQRSAGNRAVTALIQRNTSGAPAQRDADPREAARSAAYDAAVARHDFSEASIHLNGFSEPEVLARANRLSKDDLRKMQVAAAETKVGNGRLSRLLDAVAGGASTVPFTEQVGGNVYGETGRYKYHLTPDAVVVNVGMNFHPDKASTHVPTAEWFGYIASTWNKFSAVNEADPTGRRHIDFTPVAGEGHDIDVSPYHDTKDRANSGHYYAGDPRSAVAVPHEFGHLMGLPDEYERDAADYAAVAENAPTLGATHHAATPAQAPDEIARGIHAGLFIGGHWYGWHDTTEKRRMKAVDTVLAANNIAAAYHEGENPLTAQVAVAYKRIYGAELSAHVMSQVNDDKFSDWRERTVGTFQYTSKSIMGDMSDHTHPVAARHVRQFVSFVERALGRGRWTAKEER